MTELPEPTAWVEHHKAGDNLWWEPVNHSYAKASPLFTADQMRTAIQQERVRVVEECAAMFDDSPNAEMFRQQIAEDIRALKDHP